MVRLAVTAVVAAAVAAGVVTPAPALAQDGAQVARQRFREGVQAARAERWEEALTAFTEAYMVVPRAEILINLASAQIHTGLLVEAQASYEQFLAEAVRGTRAYRHRPAAEQALEALAPRIPRLSIHRRNHEATDVVELDGVSVRHDRLDDPLAVNPGRHEVTLTRDGEVVARATVSLDEGESSEVTLFVMRQAAAAEAVAPPTEDDEEDPVGGRRSAAASPWLWTAIGVVLVAGGVTAGVLLAGGEDPVDGNTQPPRLEVR